MLDHSGLSSTAAAFLAPARGLASSLWRGHPGRFLWPQHGRGGPRHRRSQASNDVCRRGYTGCKVGHIIKKGSP